MPTHRRAAATSRSPRQPVAAASLADTIKKHMPTTARCPIPPILHDDGHGTTDWRQVAATWMGHAPATRQRVDAYMSSVAAHAGDCCCDVDERFMGFIQAYDRMAHILAHRHDAGDLTILDIGCGSGIGHICFPWAKQYIGLDANPLTKHLVPATDNASFHCGRFPDAVTYDPTTGCSTLGGATWKRSTVFAIANMSLLYPEDPHALQFLSRCSPAHLVL